MSSDLLEKHFSANKCTSKVFEVYVSLRLKFETLYVVIVI